MFPQYEIIKQHVCELIDSGEWSIGHKTPSDNQLASQFHVSRMTANRALRELTDAGVLTRITGVGTFVAEFIPQAPLFEIKNIADEIRNRGHHYSAKLHQLTSEPAGKTVASELNIAVDTLVFHSIVIHCENEIPVQFEDRHVNPVVAPLYIKQDFSRITPNEYLSEIAPLTQAEHIIEAILPDALTQKLLTIDSDQPCLLLHRRTWSENTLATTAQLIHPSNRYQLGGRFTPERKPQGAKIQKTSEQSISKQATSKQATSKQATSKQATSKQATSKQAT